MRERLTRAEGFFDLGLYSEAWERLGGDYPIAWISIVALLRPLKATEKALVAAGIMAKGRTAKRRKRSQD